MKGNNIFWKLRSSSSGKITIGKAHMQHFYPQTVLIGLLERV